jgi:glutamine synthetase
VAEVPDGVSEVQRWLDAHGITWVRTDGVTIDGVVIGKHLHRSKFLGSLPEGNAISEIAYGMDLGGTPYLAWWPRWRRDALGDFIQRPDLATMRPIPGRPGVAAVMVDHHDLDGAPLPVCPRALLGSIVERVASRGFGVRASFELEGILFEDSIDAARRRGFRGLTPMSHPSPIGYSIYNSAQQAAFFDALLPRLDGLGIGIEGWHDEAAPGQFELNFAPVGALDAADAIVRTKQTIRELALERGCAATFMAKPTDAYGNGLHVHHSLRSIDDDAPVFLDGDGAMSELMRRWLAGIVGTMPSATSVVTPTVNSFRRMVGWAAAPTTATWAEDNKSTGVRVLTRSPKTARIEYRVAGGDANPYLVLAAVLAGGLAGLEWDIELPAPLTVAGWGLPAGWPHLPTTIRDAADALVADDRLRGQLGDEFVDHWVESRKWEWLMFHTTGGDPSAPGVTDWELRRSFELA